jgi:hypothetical protein
MTRMTKTVTIDRPSVAKSVSRPRSRRPATVSASALALHLDCSRTYIGKLEAEGVIRAAAGRAVEARKEADQLVVEAWNKRMLGFQGPAQPSPALGDAINAGFVYLEVKCLGCNTHQTVACGDQRRRRSMNSNATCAAASAPKSGLCLQAEPSGCAEHHQDHGQRSAFDVVAGRTMNWTHVQSLQQSKL